MASALGKDGKGRSLGHPKGHCAVRPYDPPLEHLPVPERTREPALDRNVRGVHFLAAGLAGGVGGFRAQSSSKAGGRV